MAMWKKDTTNTRHETVMNRPKSPNPRRAAGLLFGCILVVVLVLVFDPYTNPDGKTAVVSTAQPEQARAEKYVLRFAKDFPRALNAQYIDNHCRRL